MSVNKYNKHLLVLPEDDANRQIANGFLLEPNLNDRVIQILPPPFCLINGDAIPNRGKGLVQESGNIYTTQPTAKAVV